MHELNTCTTRSVVNSDENFLKRQFHARKQATNKWQVFGQDVNSYTVRYHAEKHVLVGKNWEKGVSGCRH